MLTWIAGLIFIGLTIFLILKTWNIQHSCNPIFGCPDTSVCSRKIAKPSKQFCYPGKLDLPELPNIPFPKFGQ